MKTTTLLSFLILCFALTLSGCDDDSKPENKLPGGSVKRSEHNSTVKPSPQGTKVPEKLPGGSVKRSQQ